MGGGKDRETEVEKEEQQPRVLGRPGNEMKLIGRDNVKQSEGERTRRSSTLEMKGWRTNEQRGDRWDSCETGPPGAKSQSSVPLWGLKS